MTNVISVISELKLGGGENRLLNFARAIDRSRFRHAVAALYSPNPYDTTRCGSLRRAFDECGIEVVDLGIPHPGSVRLRGVAKVAATAGLLALATARLRRLIRARRADVVDAHLGPALFTAVPAAASAGVPAVITLYSEVELWKLHDRESYRAAVFPLLRRRNLRRCSALITDSAARAADFQRYLGSAIATHVIPNGVQLRPPERSRDEVRDWFGIPRDGGSVILGQVAGLVPYKGQHLLVEAAQALVAAGHDVRVLLVGEDRMRGGYPQELRRAAERLKIADRVHIRPYPGNIADAWSIIDVHVHASSIDSLPNAVIEGMSLAKPAVVSAVGAVPEHVEDERTGLVIPPGDVASLTTALRRLVADPAFAKRLGEGARSRYLERFTPEVTARQLERCLENIAHRGDNAEITGAAA